MCLKIIHTSDWHLGHEISSFGRADEQLSFLRQLADIAAAEKPDALVVSGDVFNTATPSNTVMTMLAEELDAIRRAAPDMAVIISGGNHDSGSRLETSRAPWRHLGVEILGRVARRADGQVDLDRHVITLRNPATGVPKGVVVALPHIFERGYPAIDNTPGDSAAQRRRFMEALNRKALEAATSESGQQLPIVVMAHLAINDCDFTGHDRITTETITETNTETTARDLIGGIDAIDLADFGLDFDYLALGHIHCPQTFNGPAPGSRARYCGSPIAVSFDEDYPHSVTIAEIEGRGKTPVLRTVDISNPWPLVTLCDPGTGAPLTFESALQAIASYPSQAYLRVRVGIDDIPPAAAAELAAEASQSSPARFCKFQWVRRVTESSADSRTDVVDLDTFNALSPVEVAELYYRSRYDNQPLPDELRDLFTEVCREVETDSDPATTQRQHPS